MKIIFAGGIGGHAGYYDFIVKDQSIKDVPKNIGDKGVDGKSGVDGVPCTTKALDVTVNTTSNLHVHSVMLVYCKIEGHFNSKEIPNPRCNETIRDAFLEVPQPFPAKETKAVSAAIEYKMLSLESIKRAPLTKIVEESYDGIDLSPEINAKYSVDSFVMEVNELDRQFHEVNVFFDMLPKYKNLQERIKNFEIENITGLRQTDYMLMKIVNATVASKILTIQREQKSDLITYTQKYFDHVIQNVSRGNHFAQVVKMYNEECDRYKMEMMKRVSEMYDCVEDDIQPEIDSLYRELLDETLKVVNGIEAEHLAPSMLIKQKGECVQNVASGMETRSYIAAFARATNTTNKILSPLEVIAAIANQSVAFLSKVSDAIAINISDIADGVEKFREKLHAHNIKRLEGIELVLHYYIHLSVVNTGPMNPNFVAAVLNLTAEKNVLKEEGSFLYHDIRNLLVKVIKATEDEVHSYTNTSSKIKEAIQKGERVLSFIATPLSNNRHIRLNVSQKLEDNEGLDVVGGAIHQDSNTLNSSTCVAFEDYIYDEFFPLIEALYSNLKNLSANGEGKLELQRFRVHEILRKIQRKFDKATTGYRKIVNLKHFLGQIIVAINSIIDAYDRIQIYEKKMELASHLSELPSADCLKIQETELLNHAKQLNFSLHVDIILEQYYLAVDVFKQAVFPFAAMFLDNYDLHLSLPPANNSVDLVIENVVSNLKSLNDQIKGSNTVTNEHDMFIHNAYFGSDHGSMGPFYEWRNDEVQDQIKSLLTGNATYFFADVRQGSKLNAIKFTDIEVKLKTNDSSKNVQLRRILENVSIALTHMGESNYRCGEWFYTIRSSSIKLSKEFNDASNILSPYTLWKMELINGCEYFDKLISFSDVVSIELHGNGQYIDSHTTICNTNLREYYSIQNE